MNEKDLRRAILVRLPRLIRAPHTSRVIEELEICGGRARADIAVIADALIGIEIKSPKDSTQRLAHQARHYSSCFDYVVLVVDRTLAADARKVIPSWWGMVVISGDDARATYTLRRKPRRNRQADAESALELLWRDELSALHAALVGAKAPSRKSKRDIRNALLKLVPVARLRSESTRILRERADWRARPIAELKRNV